MRSLQGSISAEHGTTPFVEFKILLPARHHLGDRRPLGRSTPAVGLFKFLVSENPIPFLIWSSLTLPYSDPNNHRHRRSRTPCTIMPPALLTAVDSTSHVHLVIGSNPLAGARCSRSLEVGATPKVIALEEAHVHYGLLRRFEDGQAEWIKRDFRDEDLTTLGRVEVDHVVDAVFVTLGSRHPLSMRS